VGVKGHVPGGRSTSQLFTEYVLAQAGVAPEQVNYVAAGQAYDSQRAALASGTVDAIMGDEPFATRLVRQRAAYVLADFHDPQTTRRQMGGLFLNGMVATREDMVAGRSELVAKMVRTVQRTLVWMAAHTPRELVDMLAPAAAEERQVLLDVLAVHKGIYSPDGRISAEQLATVERFLHATERTPEARALRLASLVDARWAGTAP
jgi:ABC-type nitrate/sulfonate/bicarbonate transport system substrate-binding protein